MAQEFTRATRQDAHDMIRGALSYARQVVQEVRELDAWTASLASDPRLDLAAHRNSSNAMDAEIEVVSKMIATIEASDVASIIPEQIRLDFEAVLDRSRQRRDDVGEVEKVLDEARRHRRLARTARQCIRSIADREQAMRSRSVQIDLLLASELEEQAHQASTALRALAGKDDLAARISAIEDPTSCDFNDLQSIRETLAAISPKSNAKTGGDTGQTPPGGAEPPKEAEARAQRTEASRTTPPVTQGYRGKWDKPARHAKFGTAMEASQVEAASLEFFSRLWREGVPQDKVADIMFSRTSRTEGLTVHDALAYAKGVDALHASVTEIRVRFM